ncbi:PQQ-binding-like beta-propeller repeat protein [Nannocystis exedens]|nr:PQQ-binding-like beta-propeller repeat protein [Nannocystis exedens]
MFMWTLLVAACTIRFPEGDTDSSPDETGRPATTGETTTTTSGVPTTGAPTTGVPTTDAGASDSDGTTAGVSCGDGAVDVDELCDDGNTVEGDGCNADCRPSAALLWEFRSEIFISDYFRDVAVAPDGTIVAGGRWLGEGAWLTRFTAEGEGMWSKTFLKSPFDSIHGVAVGEATIDVVGMTLGEDQRDAWIAQLDGDGAIVWEEIVGSGLGDDFALEVARTPEGDLVLAGVRSVEGGLAELWVQRYAPDGAVQWTHARPMQSEPLYELGPALHVAADQIVVGFHTPPPPPSGELLFALQPDSGAELWSQAVPMSENMVRGLARAGDGDILAASFGTVVRRLSSTGESEWSHTQCMTDGRGNDVAVDSQGDVIVVGSSFSDALLCKFTAAGELRWERIIAGGSGGFGMAVALTAEDRIVVAGEMGNGDTSDAWLAMFSP